MSKRGKNIVVVCMTALFFAGFFVWCIAKPADEYSDSERRRLAGAPTLSAQSVLSGAFAKEFETYSTDQFPLREQFRALDAVVRFYGLRQKDNQGVYVTDGYASRLEYPLDTDSLDRAAERFSYLYETYMKDTDVKLYFSIVPDKNYFLAGQNSYPSMDYESLFQIMQEQTSYMHYIDITGLLDIADYYKTDAHWRQERIVDVAAHIGTAMGVALSGQYAERLLDNPFYGVYYGQAALPLPAEELYYLDSEVLADCTVYDYESGKTLGIYDMEKAHGKDPYEIYLSGSRSLLTIENPHGDPERELIIFRDSFGSSLTPLLAEGYGKVTLVDIRYLSGRLLGDLVEFKNQDVLFLYSTQVLNNSVTLK